MSKIIKSSCIIETDNVKKADTKIDNSILEKELSNIKQKFLDEAEVQRKDIISKAKLESKNILKKANEEAKEIISNTYKKEETLIEDYKRKGYKEGYDIGFLEGEKKSNELIEEAVSIKKSIVEKKEELINNLEEDIVELVIDSCKEIMNRMYEDDREILLSIIQKGLDNLNSTKKIIIKSSKFDFDFLDMYKNKILSMINNIDDIEIMVDKDLKKGGLILESMQGSVDIGLDTQLKELESVLKELLDSE